MDLPLLITGAGGRLGQALCRLPGTAGLTRAGLDLCDRDATFAALAQIKPAAVINAAALSDVDACEKDPRAAMRVNAEAPGLLAEACAHFDIPLIHILTDYVFGAEGHDLLRRESDLPCPINAYGRSKLAGERAVLSASALHMCVRVAWLFGFIGDFIDRMAQKAQSAGGLTLTEQAGTPTPVAPLAEHLCAIARLRANGADLPALLHVAGQPVTDRAQWIETAFADVADLAIRRVAMAEFASAGARPLGTPLSCALFASLFGEALDWRAPARAWGRAMMDRHHSGV